MNTKLMNEQEILKVVDKLNDEELLHLIDHPNFNKFSPEFKEWVWTNIDEMVNIELEKAG